MPTVKLKPPYPKFIWSEIIASSDDTVCCILTKKEVTIIRQALFPVSEWQTRLGENAGDLFEYTDDNGIKSAFRQKIYDLDFKLSGGYMADCLEELIAAIQLQTEAIEKLRFACSCATGGGQQCCTQSVVGLIAPPASEITPEDPPETLAPIAPEENFSKCNRCNAVINWSIEAIKALYDNGAGQEIQTGVNIIVGILAFAASKNPIVAYQLYTIAGYAEVIASYFAQSIDLAKIYGCLTAEGVTERLVCDLFSAQEYDVVGAMADMSDTLNDAGLNTTEIALFFAVLTTIGVSIVWYEQAGTYPIDEELDNYVGYDCVQCGLGAWTHGETVGNIADYGVIGNTAVFQSGWACSTDARFIRAKFANSVMLDVGTIESGSITYCSPSHGGIKLLLYDVEVWNNNTFPTSPIEFDEISFLSAVDFSVEIEISEVL